MNINQLFSDKLRLDGVAYQGSPALVLMKKSGERVEYSWFGYKEKALQAMEGLKGRNLKAGDFVAIIALNLPESFFMMLGAILMGAIPVPINVILLKETEQKELKKIIDNCQPSLVLGNSCLKKILPDYCVLIEQVLEEGRKSIAGRTAGKDVNPAPRQIAIPVDEHDPRDMLIMPYTSGTSGKLKGAMQSTAGVIDRVSAIMRELGVTNQEKIPSYMPLGHITELIATFFGQIHSGYTVYFTEEIEELVWDRKKFKEKVFPKFLQQVQPTIFPGAPKVYVSFQDEISEKIRMIPASIKEKGFVKNLLIKMIKKQLGFSKTRIFISAGSPIDQREIEFFRNLEIKIDDIYGQTETGGPILINGKRIGDVMVMIKEEQEIVVQGPCLMLGYYNNSEATMKVLEDINGSGQLIYHTGDAGTWGKSLSGVPGQGLAQLLYAGRLDDGFKLANAEFISAPKLYELENKIKKVEGVEEALVCGEGKSCLVALVFHNDDKNGPPFIKVLANVQQCLDQMGEGLYRIKKFKLLSKKWLELTPTMKVKRKAVIQKFQNLIDTMTEGR